MAAARLGAVLRHLRNLAAGRKLAGSLLYFPADLVVGYVRDWTLNIGTGPLAGKTEVAAKPFPLPKLPNAWPVYFGFADWDGDGHFDLLAGLRCQKGPDGPVSYGIYWFRNTAAKGDPKFAAASALLTIPAPWALDAFAVVDSGQAGRGDLVVSVSKNEPRKLKLDGSWHVESQLWRYRRRA
jgi:hypothetical protein